MGQTRLYTIRITSRAERSLRKLSRDTGLVRRLDKRIRSLAENPRPSGCTKIKGTKYGNQYRIRDGDWRILYAVEDDMIVVLILDVVNRKQVYKKS